MTSGAVEYVALEPHSECAARGTFMSLVPASEPPTMSNLAGQHFGSLLRFPAALFHKQKGLSHDAKLPACGALGLQLTLKLAVCKVVKRGLQ